MRDEDPPNPLDAAESLQERFNRLAPEMGLELERPSEAQRCSVGIAVIRIMPKNQISSVKMSTLKAPRPTEEEDRASISALVERFEATHPSKLPEVWKSIVLEPFIAVGTQHGLVDSNLLPLPDDEPTALVHPISMTDVEEAIGSDAFKEHMRLYPPSGVDQRDVVISNLLTVFIGRDMAATTYHFVEKYATGVQYEGNSALILLRDKDSSWRIAVYTKHNRGRDMTEIVPTDSNKL